MNRFIPPLLPALLSLLLPSAPAAEFKLGPHTFTLPDGFTIELAAPPSLAPRPIEADFDQQGHLYVTDSSGSNDKVAKQLADKPHRVLRLEDTDGDGTFDKSVVFADQMMFPEGALWLDGSLYVSAPPSIWKLTDTNNDGVADVRVEWFKGQSLGGCANDFHGPYLGPDGWIYWCKGGFEKQTHTLGNGQPFTSRASHIWRARLDGSGLEPIMTGGMDNPVGLAWSPEGELFLCGTFFQNPSGGKRDGIIHVLYGGVYGKENDVLEGHARTGDLLPMMTHLGPAAPCGIARYASAAFGSEYQNNLFVCNFNLHKITRHILKESGATYATTDSDFLVSDNTDFHPTDVFEDADGSLLIIDTGGWYKLCCPTSQLQKPDVLGGIYRIRRQDAPTLNDPRGLKIAWATMKPEELTALLADSRPSVRSRAIAQLGKADATAVSALNRVLLDSKSVEAQRNAVWGLCWITNAQAHGVIAECASGHLDPGVIRAAVHAAGLWRPPGAWTRVRSVLDSDKPLLRRAAAAALGRLGKALDTYALLNAATNNPDRALEHAIIHAVTTLNRPELARAALVDNRLARDVVSHHPSARRAALIALDQMPGGNLKPEQVLTLLDSTNAPLKQAANWIAGHHPEWDAAMAIFLRERLAVLSDAERAGLQQLLTQFSRGPAVQTLIADTARDSAAPRANHLTALRVMAAANFKNAKDSPLSWAEALTPFLKMSGAVDLQRQAVLAARALPRHNPDLTEQLRSLATDNTVPVDIRLNAFGAIRGHFNLDGPGFDFVAGQLAGTNSVVLRSLAVSLLVNVPLSDAHLRALVDLLKSAGPIELPKLLAAFSRATNEATGFLLVDSLKDCRSFRSLRPEQVRPNLTNFPGTVRAKADELLATLNTDAAKQKQQLDDLSTKLALNSEKPDVRRGQALFNGQKAACSTCHAIGYLGGNLGPDLTRIGQVRTERDLLESIVFPSASFVRSFEPMLVVTLSGEEHSGILRRDAPDEVVLATGPNVEVRIARADISELRPGTVSVMPQGLDTILTRQELADLLAFLKSTKG